MKVRMICTSINFYPRSPCGERLWSFVARLVHLYFYPRSPCGERQQTAYFFYVRKSISIHALLAESDYHRTVNIQRPSAFLSTLSLRRATCTAIHPRFFDTISIHALLAESDCCARFLCWGLNEFLSTLSLRRATSPFRFFWS